MSTEELQKKTTVNIQEKANLIWAIADKLVGTYKPHEYGNVILPMCVIKRFSDTLAPTKKAVLEKKAALDKDGLDVQDGWLRKASGYCSTTPHVLPLKGFCRMPTTLPTTSATTCRDSPRMLSMSSRSLTLRRRLPSSTTTIFSTM